MQKHWRELAYQHKKQEEGLIVRTSMENRNEIHFLQKVSTLREMY